MRKPKPPNRPEPLSNVIELPRDRSQQGPAVGVGSVMVRASDIDPRRQEWLWFGHLPRGGLELMTGVPNMGKSQVQISHVASVTTRKEWPDGSPSGEPASVIMLTAEDKLDTTLVPRLIAAGADLVRVHILKSIRTDKKTNRQFLIGSDLDLLRERISQIGDVVLVTIDPITAYMGGKIDSHKATDVRDQLGPLSAFAEEMNVCVSAITHPAKAANQTAINSFIGSQAFIAACRVGHLCAPEMGEDGDANPTLTGQVLYTHVKHNLSKRQDTLGYRIKIVDVMTRDGLSETPMVVWYKDVADLTGDQAIAAAAGGGGNDRQKQQRDLQARLSKLLFNRSLPAKEVEEEVKAWGFTHDQLRTARQKLGIVAKKVVGEGQKDGPWMWSIEF